MVGGMNYAPCIDVIIRRQCPSRPPRFDLLGWWRIMSTCHCSWLVVTPSCVPTATVCGEKSFLQGSWLTHWPGTGRLGEPLRATNTYSVNAKQVWPSKGYDPHRESRQANPTPPAPNAFLCTAPLLMAAWSRPAPLNVFWGTIWITPCDNCARTKWRALSCPTVNSRLGNWWGSLVNSGRCGMFTFRNALARSCRDTIAGIWLSTSRRRQWFLWKISRSRYKILGLRSRGNGGSNWICSIHQYTLKGGLDKWPIIG